MSSHDTSQATASWYLRLAGIALAGGAIAVVATGVHSRTTHEEALQQRAVQQNVVPVEVIAPQPGPGQQNLILPGNVTAFTEAPIYARVSGYLKNWNTDIGVHVKTGQVLGTIETPELDEQIHRAEADLSMAEANYELAASTAKRWQNLLLTDSVSHQEADEKTADAKAKQATVNALRATLDSLCAQQSFNRIVATFDGVVTDRKTDIGMLVSAGSSASAQALFRVAEIDKLRIYVEVPQNFSAQVKPGLSAELHFPEHPSQIFQAKLVSTSNALHQDSRTLTVELQMDNKTGEILPGTYAEVHFSLPSKANVLRLPTSALLFRKNGMEVATVSHDGKVVLKPITIGRDLGTMVEVVSGLQSTDQVIDSPSDSLAEGDQVRMVQRAAPAQAAATQPGVKS
jgi:RND family efflux transporter MFP subunit